MKYMGSKRVMLANGFGHEIVAQSKQAERVVDLFSGSGAVSWFAAENTQLPVKAYDLQAFSALLAHAVIGRTAPMVEDQAVADWLASIRATVAQCEVAKTWTADLRSLSAADVYRARDVCAALPGSGVIWAAYGGHYFSPFQAAQLDVALRTLPSAEPLRSLCHAAVVVATSFCAASPGHTAQPFQPTPSALPHIASCWGRDPVLKMEHWIRQAAVRHASCLGEGIVGDALSAVESLSAQDLVIVDPPYSAVQYSRFYHVLETVARGGVSSVNGAGRYPPVSDRPRSDFSLKTQSEAALTRMFDGMAAAGCRALVTFPAGECSNGLSGRRVYELASERFSVRSKTILGRFSTLGGNNNLRASRRASAELILSLSS